MIFRRSRDIEPEAGGAVAQGTERSAKPAIPVLDLEAPAEFSTASFAFG